MDVINVGFPATNGLKREFSGMSPLSREEILSCVAAYEIAVRTDIENQTLVVNIDGRVAEFPNARVQHLSIDAKGGGDDVIHAGAGDDAARGGVGNGVGNDVVYGGRGEDRLGGGDGRSSHHGGRHFDSPRNRRPVRFDDNRYAAWENGVIGSPDRERGGGAFGWT